MIEERIRQLLLNILDVDEEDIVSSASLMNDLGASSLDLVEIIAAVENEFALQISDTDVQCMLTVQAAIDYVNAKTS